LAKRGINSVIWHWYKGIGYKMEKAGWGTPVVFLPTREKKALLAGRTSTSARSLPKLFFAKPRWLENGSRAMP
jgi:hypothetical protein